MTCLGPAFYDAFRPIHLLPSTHYLLPSFCPLTSTIYPLSFSALLMPPTLSLYTFVGKRGLLTSAAFTTLLGSFCPPRSPRAFLAGGAAAAGLGGRGASATAGLCGGGTSTGGGGATTAAAAPPPPPPLALPPPLAPPPPAVVPT